ncbi:MinD/ParA family ATP-binding protein [Blastopirellula retiformator]|uniref:Flagellum site-determining protein YlxH n=1 Tax=Blastopirellula retiformator TaxID=2527970 RepID=A0A5C5VM17_9BACT|nr:division plane positioning ATPase MipZ [Blastopirellula retiformator]TWT39123.1 Flagellum site-determining protein YlxH [Blastopirellula retiformator]
MDRHFPDQASLLRMLARQNANSVGSPSVPLAVLYGAERNVGVTTLALNLGAAIAESGRRVVVVDLDFESDGLAQLCGQEAVASIGDLASSRVDLHESFLPGIHGALLLPTLAEPGSIHATSEAALERLTDQLQRLGRHADVVLIDAGSRPTPLAELLWRRADHFVLTASSARSSLTAGYAAIRHLLESASRGSFGLLLNRVSAAQPDEPIIEGFNRVCQLYAGTTAIGVGAIRYALEVSAAQASSDAFCVRYPQSAVAVDLAHAAKRFTSLLQSAVTAQSTRRAA